MDEPEDRAGKYEDQLVENPPPSPLGKAHPTVKVVVVLCFLVVFYASTAPALGVCVFFFAALCWSTKVSPLRDPMVLTLMAVGAVSGAIMYLVSDAADPIVLRDMYRPMAVWAIRLGVLGASAKVLFKWVSRRQALHLAQSTCGVVGGAALVPMFYHMQKFWVHIDSIKVALRSRGLVLFRELIWYGSSSYLATAFGETDQLHKRLVQNGILAKCYRPYRVARWLERDRLLCLLMVAFVPLVVYMEQ